MRWLFALALAGCTGFEAKMGMPDLGPSTVTLASSLVLPMGLGVNDRQVYWLEFGPQNQGLCGMLSRVDKQAGCSQADGGCIDLLTDMRFLVLSMAMGSNDVCWLESYDAMRDLECMSLATAQIRPLATALPYAYNLFSDGTSLWWVNGGANGAVQSMTIGPREAKPTTLASGLQMPSSVSADSDGIYWTEARGTSTGVVMAAGPTGDSPRMLASGLAAPAAVKPLGDYVYFIEATRVSRAHKDGSGVDVLADGELNPVDLQVDASGVYFIAQGSPPNYLDGEVARVDLDGKNRTSVAREQRYPYALTIDDAAVYWIVEGTEGANYLDGALYRAAK